MNKVIYLGSSEFAVPALEALNNDDTIEVSLVVTQPDRPNQRGNKIKYLPVKQKALDLGLEVYQPENISSLESQNKLSNLNPDLFIVCSYGQILKNNILDIPKNGSINIHASLLPKYRGSSPLHYAILNGDKESGVSIMLLDEKMDTGPILGSKTIPISEDMTVADLHDILSVEGAQLLVSLIPGYLNGAIKPQEQDESQASYTGKIGKNDTKINWNQPANTIKNFVNGLDSFPTAYTNLNGKRIKLFKPVIKNIEKNSEAGTILQANQDEGIVVACGEGCLGFNEIQVPGKKRMKVSEYLKGNQIKVNDILD